MRSILLIPTFFISVVATNNNNIFNPLNYGAKGDGVHDDTIPIRQALVDLEKNQGGILLFESSYVFLTGPFNLSSNTIVDIQGIVRASNDSTVYPLVQPLPWFNGGPDAEGSGQPEHSPVFYSYNTINITLTSSTATGQIDGNGLAWWECFNSTPPLAPFPCNNYSRPQLIRPYNVQNFTLTNLNIYNSASWTIHLANVTNAYLSNFSVRAPANRGNTDGVDIDCSSNVVVEDYVYAGGDDAIAVKSGLYPWSKYGRPTSDVLAQRITVYSGNGISIGSEMDAGVNNVTFLNTTTDCDPNNLSHGCKHGLYIKCRPERGGYVTNVSFINSYVSGCYEFGHGITMNYPDTVPGNHSGVVPTVGNIYIKNTTIVNSHTGFSLEGLNTSIIYNFTIDDVTLGQNIPISNDCKYIQGQCAPDVPANLCPPCFTHE